MNAPVFIYPFETVEPAPFADLDIVRVRRAVTTDEGEDVPAGTRGTVVAVYAGGPAYEIEFEAGLATIDSAELVAV